MQLFNFMAAGLVLAVLLSLIIVMPWLRPQRRPVSLLSLNVAVFKDRLQELEQDQQAGRLDATEYAEQKLELEKQLLSVSGSDASNFRRTPRRVVIMLMFWLPLLTLAAYMGISSRQPVWQYWHAQQQFADAADRFLTGRSDQPPESANRNVIGFLQTLQSNLYQHPRDAQRLYRMSQAYMMVEAPGPALEAMRHAYLLHPENDGIAMTYANLRFFSSDGQGGDTGGMAGNSTVFDPETRQIAENLLAKNPQHEKALMLMAMGSFKEGSYSQAIQYLQQLRGILVAKGQVDNQSGNAETVSATSLEQLDSAIARAQQAMTAAASSQYHLHVTLAKALRAKVTPEQTLFVYARALQGPPMPYAAIKLSASQLLAQPEGQPLVVTLSDQQAMMPSRSISSARQGNVALVAGARLTASGQPIPQPGDLESLPVPMDMTGRSTDVSVVIDQQR